ncbi:aa3-type cytochrome c oxidase subunit IV [Paracoccus sp. (in: a-proteobacteria)]|uniref:aa3-type cytochrome c oxidase subunit IV n=1 Tax=Paracoccus sp. TaxID=267 RepID=UPI00289FD2D2|nr:aa3-type cytochrome c oxidase subunit IV [Paracoccus sp. (in: a-proteobacteria)]
MASHQENTDHIYGEMDIREQQKTMAGFLRLASWTCICSIAVLIFLALTNA